MIIVILPGEVIKSKITALTPHPFVLAVYVAVLLLGQIGYCVMLALASKRETKHALIRGVGMSLALANFAMAIWAVCWVMQWFFAASILQCIMLLILLYSNLALYIYHPATSERPLDTAFIHAPVRLFVVLTMLLMFPYCLFVTLDITRDPAATGPWHAWTAFGIVLGTNFFALLVIVTQHDLVWCIAATWVCVSIWSQQPKPTSVYATTVAFTAIHPISLLLTMAYAYYRRRSTRQGDVALSGDNGHPGLYGAHHGEQPAGRAGVAQEGTVVTTNAPGQREDDIARIWA
ncbi:hypothetical protein AX15_000941 [Amanita polypyramis BW_CC]|nr:hypothetical protein AX15_000941 [Amanita polypyramis BW_CC]